MNLLDKLDRWVSKDNGPIWRNIIAIILVVIVVCIIAAAMIILAWIILTLAMLMIPVSIVLSPIWVPIAIWKADKAGNGTA